MSDTDSIRHFFISYSSKDRPTVSRINDYLNDIGLPTWFDQVDIVPGNDWEQKIYDGLEDAEGIILMVSPSSLQSDWVTKEYEHMLQQGRPVVPIIIKTIDSSKFPLKEIHYFDFTDLDLDDSESPILLERMIYLMRGICEVASYPDAICDALLDNLTIRLKSPLLANVIRENREKLEFAQDLFHSLEEKYGDGEWKSSIDGDISIELANIALDPHTYGKQIAIDAANIIGKCGDKQAIAELVGKIRKNNIKKDVLEALRQVWEARRDGIRDDLLAPFQWRVKYYIFRQQWLDGAIAIPFIFANIGVALALIFTVYVEFFDPNDLFPIARLSSAINGNAYAQFIALGLLLMAILLPRLQILRRKRHVLSLLVGWIFVGLTFTTLNFTLYNRVPQQPGDLNNIIWLSALFISGFWIGTFIQPTSFLRSLLRLLLAFLGVFFSIAISCDWSVAQTKLLYLFPDADCIPKAVIIAALMSVIFMLPELIQHLTERGSIFFRSRIASLRHLFN